MCGASRTAEEAHGDSFKGTGEFLAKHHFMPLCSLNKYGLCRLKHHMLSVLSCLRSSLSEGASLPCCRGNPGRSAVTLILGLPRCLLSRGLRLRQVPLQLPCITTGRRCKGGAAVHWHQVPLLTLSLDSFWTVFGAGQQQQLREHNNTTESLIY